MDRIYLHADNNKNLKGSPLRTHFYRTTDKGTTPRGTRIQQIEAKNKAVTGPYRHGLLIEPPGKAPFMAFGPMDEVNGLASQLKRNPDKVLKRVRMSGKSETGIFHIGHPPPSASVRPVDPTAIPNGPDKTHAARAQKMFGGTAKSDQPLTRVQEEKLAAKEHAESLATQSRSTNMFPSATGVPEASKGDK